MSRRWSTIGEAERAAMARRFTLDLAADDLASGESPALVTERSLRFDELHAAAVDPVGALGERMSARLAEDPTSRAAFEAVLRDRALCWFPAAAAASSGDLDMREEDGFRVWMSVRPAFDGAVFGLFDVRDAALG